MTPTPEALDAPSLIEQLRFEGEWMPDRVANGIAVGGKALAKYGEIMRDAATALAAAAPHLAAPDWRPIESDPPPKDGTPVILCIAGSEFHPRSAWWSPIFKNWVVRETNGPKGLQATVACSREFSFTHWQPLPAPPAAPQPPGSAI